MNEKDGMGATGSPQFNQNPLELPQNLSQLQAQKFLSETLA
jgi:hypothetical protein